MKVALLFPVLLFACAAPAVAQAPKATAPDLILRNGHIYTGDPAKPWVEAISIQGDKILAVGTDAAIAATANSQTRVIDLGGRMATPGINDTHDHVGGTHPGISTATKTPPMAGQTIVEVADAVRTAAAQTPAGTWIYAQVGPATIRNPKVARAAIDEAGAGHPVLLDSAWGHGVILNTEGLAALGLTEAVKDPPGGHYDRDADGHLTGLLQEYAGGDVKMRLSNQAGVQAAIPEFRAYAERRLEQGVTTVQAMASNARLGDLEQTFLQAPTPLRIRLMRWPDGTGDPRVGDPLTHGTEVLSPLVRVAGVKYVLDGTPIEELAYQTKDYADRPGWRGRPNFSVDFLRTVLQTALDGKDQLMMHVVGDAMTDQVLDQMEALAPTERWRPLRVRFEHGDGLNTPERMARAKKLGIVVAQPRPGRPFRALLDAGIPVAYGSDGGMAPFFMFAVMTAPGDPKSISRMEALAILTSGAAYAEFEERRKGMLAPGMLADIAVLSQDIMTAAPADLPRTASLLTIVGGKLAFTSPAFAAATVGKSTAR
jgi:predicted amidohydrolase YtcJ